MKENNKGRDKKETIDDNQDLQNLVQKIDNNEKSLKKLLENLENNNEANRKKNLNK